MKLPLIATLSLPCALLLGCFAFSGCESPKTASPAAPVMQSSTKLSYDNMEEMVQDYKNNYLVANDKWAGKRYSFTGKLYSFKEEKSSNYSSTSPVTGYSLLLGVDRKEKSTWVTENTIYFHVYVGPEAKSIIHSLVVGKTVRANGVLEPDNREIKTGKKGLSYRLTNGVVEQTDVPAEE